MSHHASEMSDESRKHFRKMMEGLTGVEQLGATGQFPQGQIHPTDEGELKMAIGHAAGKVFIDFGKPTAWIGFDKTQALAVATALLDHAKQL